MTHRMAEALKNAAQGENGITFFATLDDEAIAELVSAPAPLEGTVAWTPPPSYRAFLAEAGRFALDWYSAAMDDACSIELLDADGIAAASELVYLPEGVCRGDGRALSTNHLVPFAAATGGEDEWAFCFDVSGAGPEYPVFYHHQDEPRARFADTGEWDGTESTPDFPSFEAWLTWLVDAVKKGIDPEDIGMPSVDFEHLG